jgi:hypothetical protein
MKSLRLLFLVFSLYGISLEGQQKWSVLLYADPCADITGAVLNNINDVLRYGLSDNVAMYVQLCVYVDKSEDKYVAWRYEVKNNALVLHERVKPTGDYTQDITQAAQWAFGQNESAYHAVILSGHGSGVLEPVWNEATKEFAPEYDDAMTHECPIFKTGFYVQETYRALLVDTIGARYLTNAQMVNVCKSIHHIISKRVDILGLDMCLGGCIEHAYQVAPWVNYLIGCQNCELVDGFDFYNLARTLCGSNCTPQNLATEIVTQYGDYYQRNAHKAIYTLAAIDCRKINTIVSELNACIDHLIPLLEHESKIKSLIASARKQSVHFCQVPMYTDLYMIADELKSAFTQSKDLFSGDDLAFLCSSLEKIKQSTLDAVLANIAGKNIPEAHGMSIYFPYSHIDSSYTPVAFAQSTQWLALLKALAVE